MPSSSDKLAHPSARKPSAGGTLTFFRQTGWMVVATTLSGAFMYAMHLFARKMTSAEYGVLGTLLQIVNLMGIPAIGLQTIFAQQTAAALTDAHQRQLRRAVRVIAGATLLIWLIMASVIFGLR